MGVVARMKSLAGGSRQIPSLASAATIVLPDDSNQFQMTGTTAITALNATKVNPGRQVTFIGTDGTGNVFTNTNGPTAAGTMDLGGSDITLPLGDTLSLVQRNDGTWLLFARGNN